MSSIMIFHPYLGAFPVILPHFSVKNKGYSVICGKNLRFSGIGASGMWVRRGGEGENGAKIGYFGVGAEEKTKCVKFSARYC